MGTVEITILDSDDQRSAKIRVSSKLLYTLFWVVFAFAFHPRRKSQIQMFRAILNNFSDFIKTFSMINIWSYTYIPGCTTFLHCIGRIESVIMAVQLMQACFSACLWIGWKQVNVWLCPPLFTTYSNCTYCFLKITHWVSYAIKSNDHNIAPQTKKM